MQQYKNYPIYLTAAYQHGGGWKARGIVLDPETSRTKIKRVETGDSIFLETQNEAEEIALILCQAWIDGLEKTTRDA